MTLSRADIAQLSDWLAATDIAALDLRGPSVSLRLERYGNSVKARTDTFSPLVREEWGGGGAATGGTHRTVVADTPGIFLHSHPLRTAPLVEVGAAVQARQVIGLLRVGAMLFPVSAARAGRIAGYWVEHGAPVGYGTPLIELSETTL